MFGIRVLKLEYSCRGNRKIGVDEGVHVEKSVTVDNPLLGESGLLALENFGNLCALGYIVPQF